MALRILWAAVWREETRGGPWTEVCGSLAAASFRVARSKSLFAEYISGGCLDLAPCNLTGDVSHPSVCGAPSRRPREPSDRAGTRIWRACPWSTLLASALVLHSRRGGALSPKAPPHPRPAPQQASPTPLLVRVVGSEPRPRSGCIMALLRGRIVPKTCLGDPGLIRHSDGQPNAIRAGWVYRERPKQLRDKLRVGQGKLWDWHRRSKNSMNRGSRSKSRGFGMAALT